MSNPAISVVIPSFNQGTYIERTLLSILKQEYEGRVEIIVSDGGSTDNTIEVLKKYNDKITWWSEKDNGYADAVNKGFHKASGDIYAIQSSDDYYLAHAFQKLVSSFNFHKDAVLICGREAIQEPDGNIFGGYELPEVITPKSFLIEHPFPGIFQHTTIFRRDLFEKVGGLRSQFDMCADTDLFYRMLHFGSGFFLNEYIAVYQKHKAQRTITKLKQFEAQLSDLPINCSKDPIYSMLYTIPDQDYNLFNAFISLFYLQYTDIEKAKKIAISVINNPQSDDRLKRLASQILTPKKENAQFKDNTTKRIIRSLKRRIEKYISRKIYPPIQPIAFSDEINSGWWKN